jgi:auxin influx carrier (AUX1 LAX family)
VVAWVLVVGFGFGGWASMTNFVRQIDTFGLFTKCYQCPPPPPLPPGASLPFPTGGLSNITMPFNGTAGLAPALAPSPAHLHHHHHQQQHHSHGL